MRLGSNNMRLVEFLRWKFRDGIQYEDAAQLCMSLYCASGILPAGMVTEELSMDRIAEAFSEIARLGIIKNYALYKSVMYGANYHSVEDKGHWIEIQASVLKLKRTYDVETVKALVAA